MPQVTFSLTKREPETGRELHARTQADLGQAELEALITELKAHGNSDMGDYAAIYIAPEDYTLEVNGESIPLKPQFFPPEYGYIINQLTQDLK
ncbi:MAG TPA: hypothetical protein VF629_22305 [Hymenobacter sp.]|jgi:hypothetical protein|uniref:hypothetical protein n=1 Tax=Hymenobacter sp. TaxID=1898978 RepID=UPI002EDB28C4